MSLKVFHKVGFSFPLSRKIFHLQFSLIFLRENRSEAFCVSSENILHLTFCGLKMWRKCNTKPSQIYTKLKIKQLCHWGFSASPAINANRCCTQYYIFTNWKIQRNIYPQSIVLKIVFKLLKSENYLWRFFTKFGFGFQFS